MTDIIGTISQYNSCFESNYIPFISFKNNIQKDVAETYIFQEASKFFTDILRLPFYETQLPYPKTITVEDFKKVDITYFYEYLFHDLGERDSNGKLIQKIKWGITFDEKCTPIKVAYVSPNYSGYNPNYRFERRYGTIDINGTPVFYYIHFTLQEILDVIKTVPISST